MKRSITALLMAVILVGALGATAMGARRATSFDARARDAEPGRIMRIVAVVRHPDRSLSFEADATVRFASGDVSIDLERRGEGFRAVGRVRVPRGEGAGPVVVHVTILYGGLQTVVDFEAQVLDPDRDDEDDERVPPTPSPEPTPPQEN